jgi:hypothetical protein
MNGQPPVVWCRPQARRYTNTTVHSVATQASATSHRRGPPLVASPRPARTTATTTAAAASAVSSHTNHIDSSNLGVRNPTHVHVRDSSRSTNSWA